MSALDFASGQFVDAPDLNDLVGLMGIVASNGTISVGTGWTSSRTSVGLYVVAFTTPFASAPAVFPGGATGHGNYAFPAPPATTGFTIEWVDQTGTLLDLQWAFWARLP